jgi:hypothetical protein
MAALGTGCLCAMVRLRLNRQLQVDPSDVIQEAYLEVCRTLPDYLNELVLPFFHWLRKEAEALLAEKKPMRRGRGRDAQLARP